jgi:hypothetical protein
MDLLSDGRILLDSGVNVLSARFATTADGFDVHDVSTTYRVYGGNDPQRVAAIAGLNVVAYGNRDGVSQAEPARNRVVTASGARLVVDAGRYRLEFERTGPARTAKPEPSVATGT